MMQGKHIWEWIKSWFWKGSPTVEAVRPADLPIASPPIIEKVKAKPQRADASLPRDVADVAYGALNALARLDRSGVQEKMARSDSVIALEHLWGCDFHAIHDIVDRSLGRETAFLMPDDVKELNDAVWPIDIAIVVPKDFGYVFERAYSVSPKEFRGKAKIVGQKCLMLVGANIQNNGTWWAEMTPCTFVAGKWTIADAGLEKQTQQGSNFYYSGRIVNKEIRDEISNNIKVLLSAALTERYEWHAAFGVRSNGPRVSLPTTPEGAMKLFRTRERAFGESRRTALKHWVSEHYREITEETLAYVRKHLRGSTVFLWKGLNCELLVSAFDLEKNEFLRKEAAEWRAARKHNRVKLRLKRRAA